ncbi:hypothetical protein BJ122_10596 [Rhodopseudomonas faecalis]|uniref:Uncharacterized protein n=1 Tax=Rhodopseudomonas faecalis TaxID=99655 RepID=A0A318TVX1_9BRAD|nr:hypothetical protein [Rhodopseudomonas faecalis]PYF03839.1 hypothetical protein BJ122_10596 [Rhodopseudomonas faecalis]
MAIEPNTTPIAAPSPAMAAGLAHSSDDAELVRLAGVMDVLWARNRAANAQYREAAARYDAIAPAKPDAVSGPAFDDWKAADNAAGELSGLDAANAEIEAVIAAECSVLEQMLALRPTTVAGYQAIATGLVVACWGNDIFDGTGSSLDQRTIAHIMANLTGRPNPFAIEVAA